MSLLMWLLSLILFTVSSTSPLENEGKGRESLSERIRKMQESFQMGNGEKGTVEYERYWKELLANNPDLARRFKDMPPEEIAKRFGNRVAHREGNIRSQIDEMQRLNLERLREANRERNYPPGLNRGPYNDPRHPRTFHKTEDPTRGEAGDRLSHVETKRKMEEHRRVQEELDSIRKDEFKHFENRLQNMRRKKLKDMDETQRLKEEERLDKLSKERRDHEQLAHPASRKQLEDVWVKQDGLGDEKFNPKTFFYLHDSNGDNYLDLYETEALFMNEIKKVYGEDTSNVMVQEELAEMREHVFGEVDRDRDGLISLEEFVGYSNKDIFNVDEEWKSLEEREKIVVSPEDFKELESYGLDENYDVMYDYDDEGKITLMKKQKGEEGEREAEGHQQEQIEKQDLRVDAHVEQMEENQLEQNLNKPVDEESKPEQSSRAPPPPKDQDTPNGIPRSDVPSNVDEKDSNAVPQKNEPDVPDVAVVNAQPQAGNL